MDNYLSKLFGLKSKTAAVIGGTGVLCGQMSEALAKAGAHVYSSQYDFPYLKMLSMR